MRQAVISLILKTDKNPLECGSFRPISLLNTDAKVLAKVLVRRLEEVLPSAQDRDALCPHCYLQLQWNHLL